MQSFSHFTPHLFQGSSHFPTDQIMNMWDTVYYFKVMLYKWTVAHCSNSVDRAGVFMQVVDSVEKVLQLFMGN